MDRVRNLLEPKHTPEFSRRTVIILLATGFSGCSGLSESSNTGGGGRNVTRTDTRSPTDSPTESPTDSPTESPTETATPEPREGYVNLVPADEDAAYSSHSIFDEHNGEIDVELDLHQALLDRHFGKIERIREPGKIKEFANNYDDPEWRQQIVEDTKNSEYSYVEEIEDPVDQEELENAENVRERFLNGIIDVPGKEPIEQPSLWIMYADTHLGGASSTNNERKAAALQAAEVRRVNEEIGADPETANKEFGKQYQTTVYPTREAMEQLGNIFYGHKVEDTTGGSHGVFEVLSGIQDSDEDLSGQRVMLGETDPGREQQLVDWIDSNYRDDSTDTGRQFEHPAEKDVDGEVSLFAHIGASWTEDLYNDAIDFSEAIGDEMEELFNEPESVSAQYMVDLAVTSYALREQGYDVEVREDGLYVEEQ